MSYRLHRTGLDNKSIKAYIQVNYEPLIQVVGNLKVEEKNYFDPYQASAPKGFGFDPERDYLQPVPTDELLPNDNLGQNPGWED